MAKSLKDDIKMSKAFDSLETEAAINIVYTSERLMRVGAELLKKHDLTQVQYNALRILRGAGDSGLRTLDVLDRMIFGTPDITRLIDNLEKAGLAKRLRCTRDRRVVYAVVTDKGKAVLKALDQPMRDLNRKLLGHLNKGELQQISKLMVKAREHLK